MKVRIIDVVAEWEKTTTMPQDVQRVLLRLSVKDDKRAVILNMTQMPGQDEYIKPIYSLIKEALGIKDKLPLNEFAKILYGYSLYDVARSIQKAKLSDLEKRIIELIFSRPFDVDIGEMPASFIFLTDPEEFRLKATMMSNFMETMALSLIALYALKEASIKGSLEKEVADLLERVIKISEAYGQKYGLGIIYTKPLAKILDEKRLSIDGLINLLNKKEERIKLYLMGIKGYSGVYVESIGQALCGGRFIDTLNIPGEMLAIILTKGDEIIDSDTIAKINNEKITPMIPYVGITANLHYYTGRAEDDSNKVPVKDPLIDILKSVGSYIEGKQGVYWIVGHIVGEKNSGKTTLADSFGKILYENNQRSLQKEVRVDVKIKDITIPFTVRFYK